ncbi:MAG: hypothetical protein ACE5FN_01100 [Leptospirillia bacterium]
MNMDVLLPVLAIWAVSFTCYGLAGVLIKKRIIGRTPHIIFTVGGFMADFVALFFQARGLAMLAFIDPEFSLNETLKSWQTVAMNASMGMYCLAALLGFSRIVGWKKLGRWHVPLALTFLATLVVARVLYIRMIS